ncbi:MAG: autotransporter outer membrane beta-barrel domain-containing protein [Desulfobacteria bacterium]
MKKAAKCLFWIGILAALATPAFAETRTISWDPVTTYTDNTLIEAGKTVSYSAYWTTDPGLGSLHTLGTSLATTSTTFDPTVQGMTRGSTVYFTAKAVLSTGEESALSPAFSWVVPVVITPGALSVSAGSLTSTGTVGGPFTPSTQSYTLTNTGGTSINWTAAKTQTWVTLSSAGGTLAAGGTATVTATINTGANSLVAGSYSDTVTLTNTTNGTGNTTRAVALTVNAAVLSSIAVSGSSSVNEGSTATYTATGTWDNGTTSAISPAWSVSPTTYASIGAGGVLTTLAVTSNQTATVTASYTSGGVTKTASQGVTIVNVAAVLTSIAVSGPSSVNEGSTATYTATGTWDNGTTSAISPTWSVSTSYASIGSGGVLTALTVTSDQTVTVTASYGGKTGTKTVTIVNVPGAAPAAPKNIDIAGPTSIGRTEIYRLSWDPVTTNWNGAPIEPGRTVRYTAYWTDDPALSTGSLRQLASLIPDTALDFDPSANRMAKNQVVYLTVRAILDTGDESSLGSGLIWRVENAGPLPPAKGKILKK